MIDLQNILNKVAVLCVFVLIFIAAIIFSIGIIIPYIFISYVFYIFNNKGFSKFSDYIGNQAEDD